LWHLKAFKVDEFHACDGEGLDVANVGTRAMSRDIQLIRSEAKSNKALLKELKTAEIDEKLTERVFKTFDVDGDGTLSRPELRFVLKGAGIHDEEQLNAILNHVDPDGDGTITRVEFRTGMAEAKKLLFPTDDEIAHKLSEPLLRNSK